VCGVIHYYWLVKSDVRKPLFYAAMVAILLTWRLGDWFSRRKRQLVQNSASRRVPASAS
jgi:sulfoxide reductase heme-binding subunit YedZ